ncbi:phospholipase D-like domain-containing protein [Halococcoides cellulosivorans]|nr:phospholipase D-like domain-containing protein [Halococcoides cellulosivorans]
MGRAFSLTSESLGYFLGYTLVHADKVAFVSPWVSDVSLRLPVTDSVENRHPSLVEAVTQLDTVVTFVIQTGQEHNASVCEQLPDTVTVLEVDDLHAKVVVCDEFAYVGSANITHGGLSLNRELCNVVENEYRDVDTYLETELDITLDST